ncbi:Acetylxylan esterase precursor [Gimesia panareensis]|uniref:Acetylxylan esterase n=1 Tax=Gimesia panareensis TaxID=2527978 RepID=A0A517QG01_9PLAN|nr:alpha/beta hydrolase [Gimesia panareensis]QDT30467.1 Acetylxylan esterase precursor [Gimesia panareensis]
MKNVFTTLLLFSCLISAPSITAADERVKIIPDVVYGHKFGMALTFDVFQPEKPNGAGVLFMVSGGWYSRWTDPQNMLSWFKPLLDEGFTVFCVRHGSSPKFKIPEVVEDVRRSVRFIRLHAKDYGVDPSRLGVWGGSAGGHLSLVLGTTSDKGKPEAKDKVLQESDRVAAVAAYYPPTDLREFVDEKSPYYQRFPALQFDKELADDFSPLLQVTPDDPPTLLIHGDQDKLVPISHSENIMQQFKEKKVPVELLVIENAAHGFRGDDQTRASQAVVKWFQKHLAKQAD